MRVTNDYDNKGIGEKCATGSLGDWRSYRVTQVGVPYGYVCMLCLARLQMVDDMLFS